MIGRSKRRCKSCRKADPYKQIPLTEKEKLERRQFKERKRRKNKKPLNESKLTIGPFIEWRISYLPKCAYPQNNKYSTINLGKKQRNYVLKAYGFTNYADYLKSELWTSIRLQVLTGATCACGCGKPANVVHHKSYTEANLMGTSLRGLVPINFDCHHKIEFSGERKTSLGEANRKLKNRLAENRTGMLE